MSNYTQCQICGHTIPQGHPCLTCIKKNRIKETDTVITAKVIEDRVKVLSLKKDDILVLKNVYISDDNDLSFLTKLDVIKNKNITVVVLPDPNSEFLIIRKSDDK